MRVSRSAVAICAACLLLLLVLPGCGPTGSEGAKGGDANPLVGEWVDLTGMTVKFTEDVYYTNALDQTRPHYRYRVISNTKLALTAIVVENGVEFDDTGDKRVQPYRLSGDELEIDGVPYYRPGSAALGAAVAARQSGSEAGSTQARLKLDGCVAVRQAYRAAFTSWLDAKYPDRVNYDYSMATFMKLRGIKLEWDFPTMREKIRPQYAAAAENYAANVAEQSSATGSMTDWVDAGECPSGGEYDVKWGLDQAQIPQIDCSIHGKDQ